MRKRRKKNWILVSEKKKGLTLNSEKDMSKACGVILPVLSEIWQTTEMYGVSIFLHLLDSTAMDNFQSNLTSYSH